MSGGAEWAESSTFWGFRELSCAAVTKGGSLHPLESLFLCRRIGSTFLDTAGSKEAPLLFSQENIKPMAQLWFLSVLVSWSPRKSVFALFSQLPLQLKSTAWPWVAGHEEKQALQTAEGLPCHPP